MESEALDLPKQLAKIESILDQYCDEKLFLKKVPNVEPNIDLTRSDLLLMSPQDINGWRYELTQYTINLQKEIGKHSARLNWATSQYDTYLGKKSTTYKGFTLKERMLAALADDNYAEALLQLKQRSQMAVDRLSFITNKIHTMCEIGRDIAYQKGKENAVNGS